MKEGLKIIKSGKLIEIEWVYDDEKEQGSYQEFDITDQVISKLFEPCELATDVTLKDIFLLLNTELYIFDSIFGNWTEDLVTEGLTKPAKPYVKDDEGIEYLELRYSPEYYKNYEEGKNNLCGLRRPDLTGVGFEREKDSYFDWLDENGEKVIENPKGERTPWSVCMTSSNDLINIPVKLSNKITIIEDDHKKPISERLKDDIIVEFDNPEYTLADIFLGIVWELSFHGGPKTRDEFKEELHEIVANIKSEDCIPHAQVMKQFNMEHPDIEHLDMEQLDFEGIDEL